ncbi:MAG TPA: hypothetical protein VMU87_20660 [Stellaceae bacterium]|nr:hypothetical protein [Stellaceae bacterium]
MADDVRAPVDAIENVRRRMRHLAPWHIEPVPMVSRGSHAATDEALTDEARQRLARLSLQVLAVQMRNAASTGGLERW